MTEPAAPTPPPEPQTVDFCLPCVKCWYDLRGIGVRERCPECGTPVSRTMRSLFASDLGYLRRQRKWMFGFLLVPVVAFGVNAAISYTAAYLTRARGGAEATPLLFPLNIPLIILSAFLILRAMRPEGRLNKEIEVPVAAVSAGPITWVCAASTSLLLLALAMRWSNAGNDVWETLVAVFAIVTIGAWLLRNATLVPHLRRVSRRLGMKVMVGLPAILVLTMAVLGAAVIAADFAQAPMQGIVVAVLLLLISAWALAALVGVFWKFQKRIGQVLRYRETNGRVRPRSVR